MMTDSTKLIEAEEEIKRLKLLVNKQNKEIERLHDLTRLLDKELRKFDRRDGYDVEDDD